jgi:hypothetical protein
MREASSKKNEGHLLEMEEQEVLQCKWERWFRESGKEKSHWAPCDATLGMCSSGNMQDLCASSEFYGRVYLPFVWGFRWI